MPSGHCPAHLVSITGCRCSARFIARLARGSSKGSTRVFISTPKATGVGTQLMVIWSPISLSSWMASLTLRLLIKLPPISTCPVLYAAMMDPVSVMM